MAFNGTQKSTDRVDGLVQFTILALVAFVFVADMPALKGAAKLATVVPEFIALVITAFCLAYLLRTKRLDVGFSYVFLGVMFAAHVLVGVVVNEVQPGAVFAAIRDYGKYLPAFLLPLVVRFDVGTVKKILLTIAAFALIQTPVALVQRFILYPHLDTGDVVRGTLPSSGLLSIFLVGVIAVLWAFYLSGRFRLSQFVAMAFILFIPTTLNETKGTLLLLPLALLVPFFISRVAGKARVAISLVAIGAILIGAYSVTYNYFGESRGRNIVDFYTEGEFSDYLYSGEDAEDLTHPRRGDAVVWAFEALSGDPVTVLVGFGAGNVRASFTDILAGDHTYAWDEYGVNTTTITSFLWELGLIGVGLLLWFLGLVLRDAWMLRTEQGLAGALARGWVAVVVIGIVAMTYKSFIASYVHGYLFFLVSGLVVAHRFRITHGRRWKVSTG